MITRLAKYLALTVVIASRASAADIVKLPTAPESAAIRGATITLAHVGAPRMFTPGANDALIAALAGVVGYVASSAVAGSTDAPGRISGRGFQDPAIDIGARLLPLVKDKYQLSAADSDATVSPKASVKDVVQAYTGSNVILDIRTVAWGYLPVPLHPRLFKTWYRVRLQIIKAPTGQVIGELNCERMGNAAADFHAYDELAADSGQLLKDLLQAMGDSCRDEFSATLAGS